MKKFLSIIAAGTLALLAFSCVKEEKAVFDATQATAPVLREAAVGDNVTVKYTPAVFNMEFNQNMKTYHTLALVSVAGQETNQTVTTKNEDNTLTLTGKNLNNLLKARGYKALDQVALTIVVRASIQDPSRGITNGYIDSKEKYDFNWTLPEESEVQGSPYEDYTESSDWSLIGAMEAYGINWDGDLNMWTDGNGNHVAAHVTLKAGDEVKFRKDQAWAVNMGGTFGSLDSEFEVSQDGPNIKVGADGVYDLFLDLNASVAWVSPAFDPYPDYTEESNWSVIGALSLAGINWDGDIAMVSDGANHAAFAVALADADEFKFRQDKSWSVNLGGDFGELGSEFAVSQDGPNIKVGAAGVYDLFVNPDAGTATVIAAAGLKVSAKIGGDEPGPEPPAVTGWNIIGLNGDWENDILATNDGDLWIAYITATPAEGEEITEFKWRKDGSWDENYGGTFVALDQPFEAVSGGDNIKIGAGFWKVVFDAANLTITISNGEVWSLIGDFNEWGGDVDMTLTDGKWVSPATKLEGGFKVRKNHAWTDNYGGVMVALGEPFAAVAGGDNISVEAGTYVVTFDPEALTITVDALGWGVVGTLNKWGETPDIMMREEGLFLVARNVSLSADDEFKIRYNQSWDENRGGRSLSGLPVKAVPGGDNFKLFMEGEFDIYYRPDCEVIIVNLAGAELSYWGLVGTINGWGAPDKILYVNENLNLETGEVELSATDEIKIRKNEDWAENRGGTFVAFGEPFAVENNGANIKLGRAAKVNLEYDLLNETITITGEYTGEAPSAPENMYMIGAQFGNWNWDACEEMVPVTNAPGYFWITRWFEANQGFKFCAQKAWSGDFTGAGEVGYTISEGNCVVAESGFYTVYVNGNDNTVEVSPAEVYGIGDAWGADAWNFNAPDVVKFVADGQVLKATVTNDSPAVRLATKVVPSTPVDGVCTPEGWIDWWKTEYVFFDGKIAYRGKGSDQERVAVTAGQVITLDFNSGTVTVSGGSAPAGITIDGDMSDWAAIEGASGEGINAAFKVASDDKNIYFYVKRTTERMSEIWGGACYHYYCFDTDNDPATGVELWGNGPYELLLVVYPYAGSADAPAFGIAKAGATMPESYTVANAVIKGVVTDSGVETEVAIPRSDILSMPASPVTVSSWSNKGGGDKLSVTCTL